jgi:hypothetical protein
MTQLTFKREHTTTSAKRKRPIQLKIRSATKSAAGWKVSTFISASRKILRRERPVQHMNEALVGHIGADFKFKRRGKTLSDDDPIIQSFLKFYDLVFVRNVMRPGEMKVEAFYPVSPIGGVALRN